MDLDDAIAAMERSGILPDDLTGPDQCWSLICRHRDGSESVGGYRYRYQADGARAEYTLAGWDCDPVEYIG
jgi:hypothetical protein